MCGTAPDSGCTTFCPNLSGQTTIPEDSNSNSDYEVPCALRGHIGDGFDRRDLGWPTEYDGQQKFFDWVRNCRYLDPDREEVELKTCPLLWCRKTFNSKDLAARHVAHCPQLPTAWYWCLYHMRHERFLECDTSCKDDQKPRPRTRGSIPHLADRFFKWIFRRHSERRLVMFKGTSVLDRDSRLKCKKELSAGLDNEDTGSYYTHGFHEATETNFEEMRYPGDREVESQGFNNGLPELATPHSERSIHGMSHPSTPMYETYESSFTTEIPPFGREDSREPQHLINSESSRLSLWYRRRGLPTADRRSVTVKQCSNGRRNTHGTSSKISSPASGASTKDDTGKVSNCGTRRTSIAASDTHRQSNGSKCEIIVSTNILRESSDSSGASMQDPRVETVVSSPSESTSSLRSSVLSRMHRLSSRTSASCSSPRTGDSFPTPTSTDTTWLAPDMIIGSHSQSAPAPMSPPSTEINVGKDGIQAGNFLYDGLTRQAEFRELNSFWDTISPSTLAPTAQSPTSDVAFPSSPTSPLVSLTNKCFPIDPMAEVASSSSAISHSVMEACHSPSRGATEYHDAVASMCRPLYPSPIESVVSKIDDMDSSVQDLPNCFGNLLNSEPPSAMIESCMSQGDTSNPWNAQFWSSDPFIQSPARYLSSSPSLMNGSMETTRAWMPVPTFTPINVHTGDYDHYKLLSPVGDSSPYSPISPLLSSQRQHDLPPLPQSGSDIFAPIHKSQGQSPNLWNSEKTPRTPASNWLLPHDQSRHGQNSGGEFSSSESNIASADQLRSNASNAVIALPFTRGQPHCFYHGALMITHCASKQTQVRVLQALIGTFNTVWMQALGSDFELQLRCTTLTPDALFEKGIMTFQKCLLGGFPQRFEDIFAFIHLAFVATYFLHYQQNTYSVDDSFDEKFYEEALELRHTLRDKEDKTMFLKAMDCWWWLSSGQRASASNDSRRTSLDSFVSLRSANRSDQQDSSGDMRGNGLFKACAGVFDGFEETNIWERNAKVTVNELALFTQSKSEEIENLIKDITRPLQQKRGVEALQRITIDTEFQIASGLLRNIREVEVTLNASARLRSETPEVLERYLDFVMSQCNHAMPSSGLDGYSTLRNCHYTLTSNQMLQVLRGHQSCLEDSSKIPNIQMMSPKQSILNPPPPSPVYSRLRTLGSSPNSIKTLSTETPRTDTFSSQATSPATLYQDSISPTSAPPDTPGAVVSCPACSKTFKGSLQDAKSNLQRHLRTSRRHNNRETGLKCPMPACRDKARMRCDNLGPHLINVHGISDAGERQAFVYQCKVAAGRVDSNGIPRRKSRKT